MLASREASGTVTRSVWHHAKRHHAKRHLDLRDRFGSRPGYNFNDASMARGSLSFLLPVGRDRRWLAETGYNVWLWGRSARRYEEPFVAMSRRF